MQNKAAAAAKQRAGMTRMVQGGRERVQVCHRAAQRDIDLRPERHTHYYKEEFPPRFRDQMDTGRWGPGERLVFEPYTREVYAESFDWIAKHGIFPEGGMGAGNYDEAVFAG
ncbi:MAG TPA: hypothetical protein VHW66_10635 [Stellaceae bacterium]|jgi:hypothetical protein|nr:hypothetical protein [Stellaceae bacterium]